MSTMFDQWYTTVNNARSLMDSVGRQCGSEAQFALHKELSQRAFRHSGGHAGEEFIQWHVTVALANGSRYLAAHHTVRISWNFGDAPNEFHLEWDPEVRRWTERAKPEGFIDSLGPYLRTIEDLLFKRRDIRSVAQIGTRRTVMLADITNTYIPVKRQVLLDKLLSNREKHAAEYEEAMVGYRKAAEKRLAEMLASVRAGGEIPTHTGLTVPQSCVAQYDEAIEMMRMCVADEVTISQSQFQQFVMDKWSARTQAMLSNAAYLKVR